MNRDNEILTMVFDDEYLAHHGVKGMKWGVRKKIASKGRRLSGKIKANLKRTSKKKVSQIDNSEEAAKKVKAKLEKQQEKKQRNESRRLSKDVKANQLKNMSNEEIEARLKRIDLERRYMEATQTRADKRKARIKKALSEAMGNAAKTSATRALELALQYKISGGKKLNGKFSEFAKENWDKGNKGGKKGGNKGGSKDNDNKSSSTDTEASKPLKGKHFAENAISGSHFKRSAERTKSAVNDIWDVAIDELNSGYEPKHFK